MAHAPFDLHDAVDEGVRLVHLSRKGRSVICVNACPPGLGIAGDRQQLVQVFVNLLANACDASLPGSHVVVRAASDPEGARIEVRDEGEGIPEDIRARIFEPFFTTKSPGEGTGLGLSVAWSIVREHRGRIEVASAPGNGTTVTVLLPSTLSAAGMAERTS
jgi:signal transduction histidine kinase